MTPATSTPPRSQRQESGSSIGPYLLGFAVVGMVLTASGPALSHLREHLHTTDGGIALVFVAQGVGYVSASFSAGRWIDRGHGHRLWSVGLPIAVVALALAGVAPNLPLLALDLAVLGPDLDAGDDDILRVGTLSKTLGALGGFVAGLSRFTDLIVNRARSYIFTTASSPADSAAALAALDDDEHVRRTRVTNFAGVQFLQTEFEKLGIEFVPTAGNFILLRVGDGARVFGELQQLGVITRPMAGYQLPEWLRVSVVKSS